MNISENSRVWIYQSSRAFNDHELLQIQQLLSQFTQQWEAHGHSLAAASVIKYSRFIILAVDESRAGATGCSIDKSVKLMQQIEQLFNVTLFDRFNIAFREGEEVLSCNRSEFEALLASGKITEETIVFNNLVQTVKELEHQWEVPFKNSWHPRVFDLRSLHS